MKSGCDKRDRNVANIGVMAGMVDGISSTENKTDRRGNQISRMAGMKTWHLK